MVQHFRRTEGASPRERRNRAELDVRIPSCGRISARAEEPAPAPPCMRCMQAHLRASGGTAALRHEIGEVWGASPRERRNLAQLAERTLDCRRISARAEEPADEEKAVRDGAAHLRASGGTP